MNELSYTDYLFLNCFSTIQKRKEATIYYILIGKRTISTMLQCSQLDLEAFFNALPNVKYHAFQESVARLASNGYLAITNANEYLLTAYGEKERAAFFENHPCFQNQSQMRYTLVLDPIKTRVLFLLQVLSEMRHQNKRYYPIETNEKEQLWMKSLLNAQTGDRSEYAKQYGKEIYALLDSYSDELATVFAYQFEGHRYVRKTAEQIAQVMRWDEMEVKIMMQEGWLELLDKVLHDSGKFPVLSAIIQATIKGKGLASHSAEQTLQYFKKGYALAEIVSIRKLKQSTIQDHFSELAMLYPSFPFHSFMDEEKYAYLNQLITAKERVDYREIQAALPEITFFESRLIQIASEVSYKYGRKAIKN